MLSPDNVTWITIGIYFFAGACGLTGMILRNKSLHSIGCILSVAAFFCQTLALILGFHKSASGSLSIGAYLQMLAWFFLLCGLGAWWRLRHDSLLIFATLLGLLLFLMSASWLHASVNLPVWLTSPFYAAHIGALFLSLGFLCMAFIAGSLFLILEKKIKYRKNMKGFWSDMPPLILLDKINSVCILMAFPLYTLGLLAGLFWSKPVYGSTFTGDPKEIASLFIWLLLAFIFHNRLAKGWKGRKPALLAIAIFSLSIISVVAINFFIPTHHAFIRS